MTVTVISEQMEQQTQNSSVNQGQTELINQLLQPEVQTSLTALIEQLPKINELVNALTKTYDLTKSLATDEVLKSDTVGAIKELVEPVKGTVQNIAATAIEAKDRAEESNEVIGIFGLLRMLKDPQAQKLFRFMNAFLEISSEKNR
jgi:uncharacterized protein YjgD (DUF1641 family)